MPFHISAATADRVGTEVVDLGRDYLLPAAEAFLTACAAPPPNRTTTSSRRCLVAEGGAALAAAGR